MAISARRIVLNVSTAVKQWRGIAQWSSREVASPRRINLSTAMVKQWKCPSIHCNKYRDLSTNTATNGYDCFREIGYTDVADLLSTPERDFLLRSHDGQKVPVSSLKGKLVGLYLCESIPPSHGNHMEAIREVYEEAKWRGYDFEIVQITFDFNTERTSPIVEKFPEDIPWLTLPSMDPSFTKIQNIFQCVHEGDARWDGDSLVLIYPPDDDILFEFSGAELLQRWGIEGYPFTRQSLYKAEYELQKREITLQSFFPPGECLLRRPRPDGDGFDLVDAVSQLSGKRVLVFIAPHCFPLHVVGANFVSMLKSEYEAQLEESKFEVVYVSTGLGNSYFDEFTKDMPWLVQPLPPYRYNRLGNVFKSHPGGAAAAVAFNEQGELVAKDDCLDRKKEGDHLRFPFIDQDLEKRIRLEVDEYCDMCWFK